MITTEEVRHPRFLFLATILWTWTAGSIFIQLGVNDTPVGEISFLFSAGIAPSAVGLIMMFSTYPKGARKDYFKRFTPTLRGTWFVLVYVVLLLAVATWVLVMFFGENPDFTTVKGFVSNPLTFLLFFFGLCMGGPVNEEFGWRGYALDKMLIRHGLVKGSLMLGFVWGIWHLPWIFFLLAVTGPSVSGLALVVRRVRCAVHDLQRHDLHRVHTVQPQLVRRRYRARRRQCDRGPLLL